MDECIDLTRYYLEHDDERRSIAANGLVRYVRDYSEPRLWSYFGRQLAEWRDEVNETGSRAPRWQPAARSPGIGRVVRRAAERALERAGLELRRIGPVAERAHSDARAPSGDRPPDTDALGWAIAALVGEATRIAEIGGGCAFAHEAAADPDRAVVCADLDRAALDVARKQRARTNLAYLDRPLVPGDGPFDLVVAVDALARAEDFRGFLHSCIALAPRLLAAIPNRACASASATRGRAWNAGELYWVLRCFFAEVALYALPDARVPQLVPVEADTAYSPLVASCAGPLR